MITSAVARVGIVANSLRTQALRRKGRGPSGNYRLFTSGLWLDSGHSRWSKIKHDKGKEDAVKSKQRAILVHELKNASKRKDVSILGHCYLTNHW